MKRVKDKKMIILAVVLLIFTISYFIIANKISYAFENNYDLNNSYNDTIDTIKKCAIAYAKENKNLFNKEKIIYIKVQDLIDNSLLVANENGDIVNPLKNSENLNSNIIKIKYEGEEFTAEVDS